MMLVYLTANNVPTSRTEQPKSLDAMLGKARYYLSRHNFSHALDLLNQAVASYPGCVLTLLDKMKVQLALQYWEQAMETTQRCLLTTQDQWGCVEATSLLVQDGTEVNMEQKMSHEWRRGTAHLSLDSEPLLPFLMEKVAAVIPSKYEIVGLQLGLTLTQLQVIGSRHPTWVRHQRAFNDIFDVWRRRGSPPYTWRTLIAVLRSASVGEVLLSEELTSWITSNSDITGADYSIPDPPSEVTAQPTSSKSIKVSWTLPQNISKCGAIQGYELSYSTFKSSTSVLNVGVTTFAEITGLQPYTTYNIFVRTRAAGAYSEYSSPCTATTKEDNVQTEISSLSANYQSCTLKKLRIEKLIFYGTPRAGKTTLRKALLGDADASKRSSTPQPSTNIAEMCGQVIVERILATKGNDDELKWTVVQLGDMGNTLLKCMYSEKVPQHPRDPKPSHSMLRGHENVNEQYSLSHSDSALNSSPTQVADTVQELSQITSVVNHVEGKKLAISPTIQESHPSLSIDVKRLIREAAKTDEWSKVLSALHIPDKPMLLIQVIDGGGQPSFQEIFPLFISGPSVTLFIFKLTDDLENPVPVEYQPKDNAGKHKWNDKYVVKEYIFHALSSLASSAQDATDKVKNNQLRPQVLLVGTYRDELPGSEVDKKAAVERCNGSIVAWVRQTKTFHKAIYVSNNKDTFVTDISNLEPNDIRNIKKKIEDKMLERELQSIPARLLVFDFILHKHAVNRKIRKVEKTECEEIAMLCGVDRNQIVETLYYLHHNVGTLLYYPNIPELKQCVIVDFQLIFDSVSNIIVKHFVDTEVQTSPHDKGQFEVSVLKEMKCCLSIEELIALLKHRQVISPLGDDKFFMPSVLTKTETKPADASFCSFLLLFEHGSSPVGLFCAVTSRLIFTDTSTSSSPQWKLKKTEQFRNQITFLVSLDGQWYTVVFTAFSAHYEVKLLEKACLSKPKLEIYTTINKFISDICKDLHFPSPLYGFYCPRNCVYDGTAHAPYKHPAECPFSSESTQMKCYYTDSFFDLSPEQKMWFTEVHSEDQRREIGQAKKLEEDDENANATKLCDDNHSEIFKITKKACSKWKGIGRELGFSEEELSAIVREPGHTGEEDYYAAMLMRWLDWAPPNHYFPSVQRLASALRKVGKEKLALDLDEKFNISVPSAPIAIVADGITATSMTLSWQPPQDANGIIRNYQVSYTPHDGSECIHDIAGDITSTELTSLKPHTEYTIRVRAKTVDFGEYSSYITKKTLPDDGNRHISRRTHTEIGQAKKLEGFLECSKKDIYKIAGYDFDWRRVGRRLLCDQKVQDIDHEGGSEGEKKEKMLLEWKRTKSRDATYQALVKGLRAIENNATADQVEELLERKSKRQRVK